MSDGTKIEWTEATWNIVTGCSVLSPGCTNCYAMKLAGTRLRKHDSRVNLTAMTKAGPVWTGEVRFNEQWLDQPLRWKRPRIIFVCAHGDLFHESVPDEWIDRVFAVMALCPQHTFQVLTKRSARMRDYIAAFEDRPEAFGKALAHVARAAGLEKQAGIDAIDAMLWPLENVWLGVSVEDQQRADERIPDLLATPAAVRWLSCEPLLGPVDLNHVKFVDGPLSQAWESALNGKRFDEWGDGPDIEGCPKLDWIVAGGESGTGARPMHPDWARSLRDQCAAAEVPFFFKQWGEWFPYGEIDASGHHNSRDRGEKPGLWHVWKDEPGFSCRIGKRQAGRLLDGVEHNGMPAHG